MQSRAVGADLRPVLFWRVYNLNMATKQSGEQIAQIPKHSTKPQSAVPVAVMPNPDDLAIARDRQWYRIPVDKAEELIKPRWPPEWIAFRYAGVFGDEANIVQYYAHVLDIRLVSRRDLFTDEPDNQKSKRQYYQLILSSMEELPHPILGQRRRHYSVFIPTTWKKFLSAVVIDDLYDDSPLEDLLWVMLKQMDIAAQRQFWVRANGRKYALDFAIFCGHGKIDIETDGAIWHTGPERIVYDGQRDDDLMSQGWVVLRFNGQQIRERHTQDCIPKIMQTVKSLGGLAVVR